ncbi:MAG: hypothetical protein HC906_16360, partial [Bacteroidales bacterium]|nr:hypothetical protein [Bacteroidales bacterium]
MIYKVMLTPPVQDTEIFSVIPETEKAKVSIVYPVNIYSENQDDRTAYITLFSEDSMHTTTYQIEYIITDQTLPQKRNITFIVNQSLVNFAVDAGKDLILQKGEDFQLGLSVKTIGGSAPYTYQWYDSNQSILLENQIIITPEISQTYLLLTIDSRGCMAYDSVHVTVINPSSINSTIHDINIRIFPNPISEQLTIQFDHEI